MEKDIDPDLHTDVSDVESLSSAQEINLLADSSQVSAATAAVQAGTLPQIIRQRVTLPSSLMESNDSLGTSNVQLGLDTTSAEYLPLPVSEDDTPSKTLEGLDDPRNEEPMDVVIETTEEEQLYPLTEQAAASTVRPTEIRLSYRLCRTFLLQGWLRNLSIVQHSCTSMD